MIFLFFDCETTGIFEGCGIPRLVQLGWAIFDEEKEECIKKEYLIIPNGFVIPDEAEAIHNISTLDARTKGFPAEYVISEFIRDITSVDLVIAHNFDYDSRIIENEAFLTSSFFSFDRKNKFCTMKSTAHICRIPGPYGDKWPRLTELHNYLFGEEPKCSHKALPDAMTCGKCFFELKKRKLIDV